jgi:hypothetical protein
MLLSVPGANWSDGWPGTVTCPGLVGCLNCRWLPLVRSRYQPSSRRRLITSRTFIAVQPLRPSRRERRDARIVAAHSGEKAGSNVALLGAGLGCPLGHRAPGPTAGLPNSGVVRRQVLETFGRWGVPVRRPEHSATGTQRGVRGRGQVAGVTCQGSRARGHVPGARGRVSGGSSLWRKGRFSCRPVCCLQATGCWKLRPARRIRLHACFGRVEGWWQVRPDRCPRLWACCQRLEACRSVPRR